MQSNHLLESLLEAQPEPNEEAILQCLLPPKLDSSYSLDEIEGRLRATRNSVELVESRNNSKFDTVLDKSTVDQIERLHKDLNKTQLDVMKLQCEIAYTKEQYDNVNSTCDNSLVQERRELLLSKTNIEGQLQQLKFEPIKGFFAGFVNHLCSAIEFCNKLCTQNLSDHRQLFDWSQYRRTIALLRACGKLLLDIDRFERLYHTPVTVHGMSFKQPLEYIDYNNFIEFPDTYSLETQLQISLQPNQQQDLKELLSNTSLFPESIQSQEQSDNKVFSSVYSKLKQAAKECCKLLVDLNMNYIEAHLTDGINIDRLNGCEDSSQAPPEEQTLPIYAFSPQEYITQIGQHLLTLRKQTEQFDEDKNGSLRVSLEYFDQYQNIPIDVKAFKTVTEIIMRCIARHCIRSLLARTNKSILSKLTLKGKRQLATDALYLDNVLEDLNLLDSHEPNVEKFKSLLVQH